MVIIVICSMESERGHDENENGEADKVHMSV